MNITRTGSSVHPTDSWIPLMVCTVFMMAVTLNFRRYRVVVASPRAAPCD